MKLAYARIVTEDVPALGRFYEPFLGTPPRGNERYAVFDSPGGDLAISSRQTMDLHGAGAARAAANGSMELDFEVPDVEAEHARLRELRVNIVMALRDQPWGNRSMMFRDRWKSDQRLLADPGHSNNHVTERHLMTIQNHTRMPGILRASPERSARRTAGLVLIVLPGVLLAGSAIAKFAGVPGVVRQMAAAGFAGPKLTFIATLEMLSAALFLLPRTRSLGLLLVSSYLGGAIATHVQAGDYPHVLPSSALLALAWIGTAMRHREMLWSLNAPIEVRRS